MLLHPAAAGRKFRPAARVRGCTRGLRSARLAAMYLLIVGAGPVGSSLVKLALKDGHNVVLIESNEKRAQEASQTFDATVLHADIGQGGILDEAGAEKADALVAVTSDDSANLMAMFLGAERGIKTLVSVVNEKEHQGLFERLGVHVLVDPEVIVAQHLYGVLTQPSFEDVVTLPGGGQVFQITAKEGSPLVGTALAEAGKKGLLPEGVLILLVRRAKETHLPDGKTVLQAGDHVTVFVLKPLSDKQLKAFTG